MSSSARSPYVLHPQSEGHPVETNEATVRPSAPETFEERNTRTEAAMIMASNERLEWHARARNEVISLDIQTNPHLYNAFSPSLSALRYILFLFDVSSLIYDRSYNNPLYQLPMPLPSDLTHTIHASPPI